MTQGWVSLHRKINDNFLHPKQENRKFTKYEAWIDLIMRAAHKEYEILINSQCIKLNKGEIVTSELRLAELWNWDRRTVKKFLTQLKQKLMIKTVKVNPKNYKTSTILKVTKYAEYQLNDNTKSTSQSTTQCATPSTTERSQYNNVNNFNKKGFSEFFYNEGLVPDEI